MHEGVFEVYLENGTAHSNNLFFGLMMEALSAMQDIMTTQRVSATIRVLLVLSFSLLSYRLLMKCQ